MRDPATGTGGPRPSRLARGGALNLVGALSAGLMGLASVFVVTHAYPRHVAGAFFAATSLFIILGAVAGLGSDAGLLRMLPRHLALGEGAAARRTVPVALVPVVTVACLAGIALAAVAPWAASAFGADDPDRTASMLRVLAVFLPVAAGHEAVLAATRGYGTMRPTVIIEKIFRQWAQVVGVLLVGVLSAGPVALALAWALPYLAGLVAAVVCYRRSALGGAEHPRAPTDERPDTRALAGAFWRYTAPRALAQICQTALQRVDIVLVAALASPRDAAVYTAATRFMVVGQLGTQAVQQAMQPVVSRLLALSDRARAARVFSTCTTWTVALTWPVHLSVAVAAPIYLSAFGSGYSDSGQYATVVLALTMLAATAAGPVDVMLLMAGRSGLSLANNTAALVVNLGLNAVLIPWQGVTGAAIAWAAAILTRNLPAFGQVRRVLGMTPAGSELGLTCTFAVACFGLLPSAVRLGVGTTATLGGLAVGAVCYGALLWTRRRRLAPTVFATSPAASGSPLEPEAGARDLTAGR